jgi:hypothetical protein
MQRFATNFTASVTLHHDRLVLFSTNGAVLLAYLLQPAGQSSELLGAHHLSHRFFENLPATLTPGTEIKLNPNRTSLLIILQGETYTVYIRERDAGGIESLLADPEVSCERMAGRGLVIEKPRLENIRTHPAHTSTRVQPPPRVIEAVRAELEGEDEEE